MHARQAKRHKQSSNLPLEPNPHFCGLKVSTMFRKTFALIVALGFVGGLFAADFTLDTLPQAANPTFDLTSPAKTMSFYDFMHSPDGVGTKLLELAPSAKPSSTNVAELKAGHGISMKLGAKNYVILINFPNLAQSGRAYGWTSGRVGDWSDKMYLDHLAGISIGDDSVDEPRFYLLLVQFLGTLNVNGLEGTRNATQRVFSNFAAIYAAEAWRARVPQAHKGWDDALSQVTMLAAFHGGQLAAGLPLTKFYQGQFSSTSKVQGPGVYGKTAPGPSAANAPNKEASLDDYWQFSANPTSHQSGVNETRHDFELMGQKITEFEAAKGNALLAKIQAVVGGDSHNVIKSISQYFSNGHSTDTTKIDQLSKDVSAFLMQVRADAKDITASLQQN